MNRVVNLIGLLFLTVILVYQPVIISDTTHHLGPTNISGEYGGVRIDENDITFLFINGSFYNMGLQLGSLIKEEIKINYRAFTSFYGQQGIEKHDLIQLWHKQAPSIPQEVKDYIQGCSDALNITFEDMACIWVAEGAAYTHRCSSFSAWGKATYTGDLIHARSLEFPLSIEDPITHSFIQDYPVIVIADPINHHAFTYPTYAGYVVEDGMNEKGIAISNMWSENHDQTDYGKPMGVRIFEALYSASTAEEAIEIMTSNRTYGYNFIISDAKEPIGYAVETTASKVYAGTWDDPSEQIRPFWPIQEVVRRSNCFLDPDLAEEQRQFYRPNSLYYWTQLLTHQVPWAAVWSHYKTLSIGLEQSWGKIDCINAITLIRTVYHGGYDPIWNILLSFREDWTTWWQWVANPKTGEFTISFAEGDTSAHWTPIISFDLLKSIEEQRPVLL